MKDIQEMSLEELYKLRLIVQCKLRRTGMTYPWNKVLQLYCRIEELERLNRDNQLLAIS